MIQTVVAVSLFDEEEDDDIFKKKNPLVVGF